MTLNYCQFMKSLSLVWFVMLAAGASAPANAASTPTIQLAPGSNVQAVVKAAPAGTTFLLSAGVYRMQSVLPKNNDTFIGNGSVIFNGSQLLAFAANPLGSGFWVAPASVLAPDLGFCNAAHPLCNNDQDLFIDGVLQTPATALAGLAAGSWYFDRAAGEVYVPSNPAGHAVELGMAQFAFSGTASGVVVQHVIVEEYANPAQTGAVGGYKDGNAWIARYVESRFNHGTGISLG